MRKALICSLKNVLVIYERLMKIMALFKKVSAATLALLMTASAVSASAAGTKILLTSEIGDADNNGAINTLDYVTMEEYIVNRSKSAQQDADYNFLYNADYNFDEKTDVADVALLVKVMLEGKQASALTADEAAEAFEAMKANYIKLEKSGVKSELKTSYNGAKENTTINGTGVMTLTPQ